MARLLCAGRLTLLALVFSTPAARTAEGAGGSPREALTARAGSRLPHLVPYRAVPGASARELLTSLKAGERAVLILDQVTPERYAQAVAELREELDATLAAVDRSRLHGLVLGRGNVPWGGGLQTLNALYRHLKSKWGMPVFQWYAPPLGPHPGQLADGWVASPTGLGPDRARRYLIKFLVTGRPVLRLEGRPAAGGDAAPLLSLCHRLAVPASFLAAAGCFPFHPGRTPRGADQTVGYELSGVWGHMPAEADILTAQPVQVGGDRVKRFDYADPFREQWFLDDATIVGVSRLRWLGDHGGLKVLGKAPRRAVTLTYHFLAPWETRELVVELAGSIKGKATDHVELALSLDGERFMHAARAYGSPEGNPFHLTSASSYRFDRESFYVRVTAELSPGSEAALGLFRANCRVKPPGLHVVALRPGRDGRFSHTERFVSRRMLQTAEVDDPRALEWRRGGFFVRGHQGESVEVHIRQRFETTEPLGRLVVRVHNAAVGSDGAVANAFALSTDGSTPVASARVCPRRGAWFGITELKVDSPSLLAGATAFYLHITLSNAAGETAAPSNILSAIEVEAVPASAAARVATAK